MTKPNEVPWWLRLVMLWVRIRFFLDLCKEVWRGRRWR
jgi:hypothetical protein